MTRTKKTPTKRGFTPKQRAAILRLLHACQEVVCTREYRRIRSCLLDISTEDDAGTSTRLAPLKSEFEEAAIAVARMIGCGPKETP